MPLWRSSRAKISTGAVFRSIDRWGTLESTALSPQAVNLILKKRARLPGLDAVELSAHGLRSGYLTERPGAGSRWLRPCSSPSTAPCSRPPATTMRSNASAGERRGSSDESLMRISLIPPGVSVHSAICDGFRRRRLRAHRSLGSQTVSDQGCRLGLRGSPVKTRQRWGFHRGRADYADVLETLTVTHIFLLWAKDLISLADPAAL